ncbi:unnamed protein product, partial [Ectocarpus sp. 12 AP-2014]
MLFALTSKGTCCKNGKDVLPRLFTTPTTHSPRPPHITSARIHTKIPQGIPGAQLPFQLRVNEYRSIEDGELKRMFG